MDALVRKMTVLVVSTDKGIKALRTLCEGSPSNLTTEEIKLVLREYVYFKAFLVSFYYFFSKGNINDWESVNKAYLPLLGTSLSHDFDNYGLDAEDAFSRYGHYWDIVMKRIEFQQNTHNINVDELIYTDMCSAYIKVVGEDLFKRTNINISASMKVLVLGATYDSIKKEFDKGNSGGCYVATCVYGSYDCPEVWVLRRFRDSVLGETWIGKAFVCIYYRTSPALVGKFGKTVWFRRGCKYVLDKFVDVLRNRGLSDLPYRDKQW